MSENAKQRQESPAAAAFKRARLEAEDEPLENLEAASAIFDALACVPEDREPPEGWILRGQVLAPVLRRDLTAESWALYVREHWFHLKDDENGVQVRVSKALQAPYVIVQVNRHRHGQESGFAGEYLIDVQGFVEHFVQVLLDREERKADG